MNLLERLEELAKEWDAISDPKILAVAECFSEAAIELRAIIASSTEEPTEKRFCSEDCTCDHRGDAHHWSGCAIAGCNCPAGWEPSASDERAEEPTGGEVSGVQIGPDWYPSTEEPAGLREALDRAANWIESARTIASALNKDKEKT